MIILFTLLFYAHRCILDLYRLIDYIIFDIRYRCILNALLASESVPAFLF